MSALAGFDAHLDNYGDPAPAGTPDPVRKVGELRDQGGNRVPVELDHGLVVVGAYRFDTQQRRRLLTLLLEADRDAPRVGRLGRLDVALAAETQPISTLTIVSLYVLH